MAPKNIFAQNSLEFQLHGGRGLAPEVVYSEADPQSAFASIATKYNVPVNVLLAMEENDGNQEFTAAMRRAEANAKEISRSIKSGTSVDQFLAQNYGDKGAGVLERAYNIADGLYPLERTEEPGIIGDVARQTAGSVVKGGGAIIEGAGRILDRSNVLGNQPRPDIDIDAQGKVIMGTTPEADPVVPKFAESVGDYVRGWGDAIQGGVSKDAKEALRGSTPDGELFSPSTWTLGENPSLKGYSMLAADVFGSFLPVVLAAMVGGPGAAIGVGGSQGAGAGAEQAREVIDAMAADVDEDGVSALENESAYFREALASGKTPEEALELTREAAAITAAEFTAPISAFGGAATAKILSGGVSNIAKRGITGRILGTAAASALEEGLQEAAEGVATRFGVEAATGAEMNLAEGTFGDFMLGAIGGGPIGGVSGALSRRETPTNQSNEIVPVPTGEEFSGEGGSNPEDGPTSGAPPSPPKGEHVPDVESKPFIPTGPLVRVDAVVNEVAAEPDPEIQEAPQRFPDMKPGKDVLITDTDGRQIDAVFIGETETGVMVRVAGDEFELTRQEFDQALADTKAAKRAPKEDIVEQSAPTSQVEATSTVDVAPLADVQEDAAAPYAEPDPTTARPKLRGLAKEAVAAIQQPAPVVSDTTPTTSAEAMEMAAFIENQAKTNGWNTKLKNRHTSLLDTAARLNKNGTNGAADVQTMNNGNPFVSEDVATRALRNRRLVPAEFNIKAVDGGFVAEPKPTEKKTTKPAQNIPETIPDAEKRNQEHGAIIDAIEGNDDAAFVNASFDAKVSATNHQWEYSKKQSKRIPKLLERAGLVRPPESEIVAHLKKSTIGNTQQGDSIQLPATKDPALRSWAKAYLDEKGWYPFKGNFRKPTDEFKAWLKSDDTPSPPAKTSDTAPKRDKQKAKKTIKSNLSTNSETNIAEKQGDIPTRAEITKEAKKADPDPTDAQKEAENYKKGHIKWNGLDISIENAKGSTRSGADGGGKPWSVKMPAHYGYIKRTEGADGDHVDVYVGDTPYSSGVYVVDQIDLETGKFDEHKVMIGFQSEDLALKAYDAGFSDNKGPQRRAGVTGQSVRGFKAWLKSGDTTRPVGDTSTNTDRAKTVPKPDQKPVKKEKRADNTSSLTLAEQDELASLRAQFRDKIKNQLNSGLDPELVVIGAKMATLYIKAGARRFRALVQAMMEDLGLTFEQAQPYARNAYNQVRDDMELEDKDISGMDDARAVMDAVKELRKQHSDVVGLENEPISGKVEAKTSEAKDDADRIDASDGRSEPQKGSEPTRSGSGESGGLRTSNSQVGATGNRTPERTGGRSKPETDDLARGDERGNPNGDVRTSARNHIIQSGDLEVKAGEKTRARNSIAAIRVLRDLQKTGLNATPEQSASLALYGGAGTLAGALPRSDGTFKHADLAVELEGLLSKEEMATLSRTSQYAFYTAETALRGMWQMAERLGFKGGRVYEPGMGIGGFAGTMPKSLKGSKYTGIELDHVTADVAQNLYPGHNITRGDFIEARPPLDYYDLVIGNPPFSGTKIQADPKYPQRFMIHDYFFAKSIDSVRPGGLLIYISSAGTMNKSDTSARDYLADRADLVGAIRLPQTAFKENGTEVTTDIVILRKRLDGQAEGNPSWRKSVKVTLPRVNGMAGEAFVNQYFVDNPHMILGEQGLYDTLTASDRIGVREIPGSDLRTDLAQAIKALPSDVMSQRTADIELEAIDTAHSETKSGSYYLKDGILHQFDGEKALVILPRSKEHTTGMPKSAIAAAARLVPIRDALRDVYASDAKEDGADAARKRLNQVYDRFVKEHGPIGLEQRSERKPTVVQQEVARQAAYEQARIASEPFDIGSFDPSDMLDAGSKMSEIAKARKEAREDPDYSEGTFNPQSMPNTIIVKRPNIDAFMLDPESFRLLAIEDYDSINDTATKTTVFRENAVARLVEPAISSPEDALLHLLGARGIIDIGMIAGLAKSDEATVKAELSDKIFLNPDTKAWETRSKYLSGNVREKLAKAEADLAGNPEMESNVKALLEVQPDDIPHNEIRVPLGAHWFGADIYAKFAKSLGLSLNASFKSALGLWIVAGETGNAISQNEWGTPDLPFGKLMGVVMNNKKIEIKRTTKNSDGSTTTITDQVATQTATDKAREIQEKFSDWLWSDADRTSRLEITYNTTFNSEVAPEYDGGYLTTPGVHADWRWRPHQTNVIARILQSGNTYMAHTVGAGKTSAMIGAAMEGRRLGLVKKPMFTVPNHMLVQFTKEFYEQYPLANIAVADEKKFHTSRRKQFVADITLGDYDAIIITHSAFGMIPPSEAARGRAIEGMLSDVREILDATENDDSFGGDAQSINRSILGSLGSMASVIGLDLASITKGKTKTRKKIEAILEAAEQKIKRQLSTSKSDNVFDFDEIGIDQLFVDEAHLFRKLSFATTNGNIKGIDATGSIGSMDLYVKTKSIDAKTPGRGVVFASGTPVTNTMAEVYTISRFLQEDALKNKGIGAFDAWAATFGTTESALEQAPDGGYKQVTRFAKFLNTPELSLMLRQVMDSVSSADLDKYVTRPKIKGGNRNLVVVDPSPEVKSYQLSLKSRMTAIQNRGGPPEKGQDILLSVINDGRMSAIDMRLVNPEVGSNNSKLERMVRNIHRIWKDGASAPLHGVKPEGGYTTKPVENGPSTQIVFSTLGVNPSKHNSNFSVHGFIKSELIKMGVPGRDIIMAKDLKTHGLKQRAFNDLNDGKKRILIGSKSIFTGVNAQRRVAAIHNLDPLWFPADDEQRNGRGIRQGNMNPEIEIFDYSTKATYDSTMWQMMGRKAAFIEAFFRGDPKVREIEDLGEASTYEQAKAMTTSDPRVLVLTEKKAKRDELKRRRDGVARQKSRLRGKIKQRRAAVDRQKLELKRWIDAADKITDTRGDKFGINMGDDFTAKRPIAGEMLVDLANAALGEGKSVSDRVVAKLGGIDVLLNTSMMYMSAEFGVVPGKGMFVNAGWSNDPVGLVRRIEGAVSSVAHAPSRIETSISEYNTEIKQAESSLSKVADFGGQPALDILNVEVSEIEDAMLSETKDAEKAATSGVSNFLTDESGEFRIPHVNFGKFRKGKDFATDLLTDAMAGKPGMLSLVPGRALFTELGKNIKAAKVYIRMKEEMDALRNEWQARTSETSDKWRKMMRKDPDVNETLMDIMHRSTIAGIDPSKPFDRDPDRRRAAGADTRKYKPGDERHKRATTLLKDMDQREVDHAKLRAEFFKLPKPFQAMFSKVAGEYSKIADDFEAAVVQNIDNAMRIGLKRAKRNHAKEKQRIADEGLAGEEFEDATKANDHRLSQAEKRNGWAKKAKIAQLRASFESNRINGVYFPLSRFGDFFVTLRDESGAVVSFSRFEKAGAQKSYIRESEKREGITVSHGVLSDTSLRGQVDPSFVADIQEMLGEFNADHYLMDAVWQKWLETLPDHSIRTSRIHRKNRKGFAKDAYRAFASHMFHGAHQLARLKYGMDMEEALADAHEEASKASNPERSTLIVNEMDKRHEFAMNPKGGAAATTISSIAFVWYLGATPAAAMVNLSQTAILGIPLFGAHYRKSGLSGSATELGRAAKDFAKGKADATKSGSISTLEALAIKEAYRRGTVDKSQAHELASVAESGVEYNGTRENVMRKISFMFHHAERANREITFLAGYRLARKEGMDHEIAIEDASNMTWKVHFDYQNTSRPRIMQNDTAKVLLIFRQFTINMIWRLVRDTHQSLRGSTKADRIEARRQVIGITMMMFHSAGIRGVWGYGLLTMIMGMIGLGGEDDDEVDAWLQDALIVEGQGGGAAAWNYMMGMVLNGIPGHVTGISLSERIGMPDLWFRGPYRDMEGYDLANHWIKELLGPAASLFASPFVAAANLKDGNPVRALESIAPKFARDISRSIRYTAEGVTTRNGDPILEDVSPYQAFVQAVGFTPAQVAERYKVNSLMKNREQRIIRARSKIQKAAREAIIAGTQIPQSVFG